ncbi:MAG TPA: DUF5615 family PIN-like protein [Niabella sp.]|nr:DUF5615 family PIN-like protein [Niabella sp.]HUN02405.1 DUF5615 family PIN-like protein [Niabella sp.]
MPGPFLIDENLSKRLIKGLLKDYPGSLHVTNIQLGGNSDWAVWNYAKESDLCILTKDRDFYSMSILLGCPPKVIRLNCGNATTDSIIKTINKHSHVIREFNEDMDTCYLEIQ